LILALYEWSRQAEFSADRAGLLVAQSLGTATDAMINLTAGPNRLSHEVSRDAYLDQARAYQDADGLDEFWKIMIFMMWGKSFTHPMPVHRAQQLERWVLSGKFDEIMSGKYEKTGDAAA
jgi:Zn-dependent protease with chaperone function